MGQINKRSIDALKPSERVSHFWDDVLKGFGVKVTPRGRKVYIVKYRIPGIRKSHTFTIGRHGSPWTPDQARKEAARVLLEASQGSDPNAEKRRRRTETADYTFDAYADKFVERYLMQNWPGSADRAVSILRKHAKPFFKGQDIREITRADCTTFIESLSETQATARKAAEVVGRMFRWAEDRGDLTDRSPMDRVPRPKPSPGRERVLSDAELKAIWQACATKPDHPFSALVRFLILSGQRRGEVGGMQWDELDEGRMVWEVPVLRTKSRRGNVFPLTSMMLDTINQMQQRGALVFSFSGENPLGNHSKLKKSLDAQISKQTNAEGLPPWTLHDLRRTVATNLQRLGVGSDMIEVIQGRTKKLGAGIRYQRYDYLEERREALTHWNNHLRSIIG